MKSNIKLLAFLISFSLLSILILQIYFALEVYKQKTVLFTSEVNQAFEKAVTKTNEQRLKKINELFEKEIRDSTKVKLSADTNDDEPRLVIIDPKTGSKQMSITIENTEDTSYTKNQLVKLAIGKNWKLLKNGEILYWTQDIGELLKVTSDTLSISKELLQKNLKTELSKYDIQEDFTFIKTDTAQFQKQNINSFRIKMLPVKLSGETLLTIKIKNAQYIVFKRLLIVFISILFALALLTVSFMYLYQILKRQKQISALKDDFIDNVTHELITPTATLQLSLDTLEKNLDNKNNKYVKISKQHSNRIEYIVNQILQTSFNHLDKNEISINKFDISEMISEIVNYYDETNEKFQIHFSFDSPLMINSNKEYINTVLHNVINNAVKYGNPMHPKVKIELEKKDQSICIFISDNGLGIPKEHQSQIFDKFHRVPSKTHEVKGLGIGLYQSKQIMQKLNGDLFLVSSTSSGSCFGIKLKKYQDEA